MRVIAGTCKGRRLAAPKGDRLVRPTADRVKESVFSILREQVVDANFLDLCAGTGSIGIEALSRGAKHVTFLERDPRCIGIIEKNLRTCGLLTESHVRIRLLCRDAVKGISDLGKRSAVFEIIYFDPPYGIDLVEGSQLYTDCLKLLAESSLLRVGGVLLVEHAKQYVTPNAVGSLRQSRQARYGDTVVSFYEKSL
jgi:16S rRNA (guanine(966)-N(2))-methyltransferase RsmD